VLAKVFVKATARNALEALFDVFDGVATPNARTERLWFSYLHCS
jgi:hypothetical protein